jgi:threonine synthase
MHYYSTNGQSATATLAEAVTRGLAPDKGLYMPEKINAIPAAFFNNIEDLSLQEIAYVVANTLFGDDVDSESLKQIVYDTLSFDIPLVKVTDNIYSLELFHGPTMAFKDVGSRFMARLLSYFNKKQGNRSDVNVLVATSGDTGSAVANGFLGVDGIKVFVLYPSGKVSRVQESQFTTLEKNITALEVHGTFDDCQAMVKDAFMDSELNSAMVLTSANSINIARLMPQMFYYFYAYAQLKLQNPNADEIVVSVPSGNFGNLTAGLIAKKMGLPIKRFIAANNANDVFYKYLCSGIYTPKSSIETIANAMDVGNPSNFARILDLYKNSYDDIKHDISGVTYSDAEIADTIKNSLQKYNYLPDPHGAVALRSLMNQLSGKEVGIFLETAHPAKFGDTISKIIGAEVELPAQLRRFINGTKQSVKLSQTFPALKKYLLSL